MKKLLLFCTLIACEDKLSSSCDDYVDYVCSCHGDNPDYDCSDLSNIYSDPDTEQLLECSSALDEQKILDEEAEFECEI